MAEEEYIRRQDMSASLLEEKDGFRNKIRNILKQSTIQPTKKAEDLGWCQKALNTLDIFSFIPVPQTYPVSTKRSKCGSITLMVLFVGYVVYDFVSFLLNNPPKVNTYLTGIPQNPYPVPEMAIGYIYGPSLNMTLNDPNYFNIQLIQVNTTQGKGVQTIIPTYPCPELPWMNGLQSFYQNLTCFNTSQVSLEGVLYVFNNTLYPRLMVVLCNNTAAGNTCASDADMQNMTSGGRIFLFIKKEESTNLATGKHENNAFGTFTFYNYFLIPQLYSRATIYLQPNTYYIYPDYITSFSMKTYNQLIITNQLAQISNVTYFNQFDALSISILLDGEARTNEVVYSTLIQHISLWGAFWGVLFSVFAIIFLAYNRKIFYKRNPEWVTFEEKMSELEKQLRLEYEEKLSQQTKQARKKDSKGVESEMTHRDSRVDQF